MHIHIQVIFLSIGTDLAFKNSDKFLFNNFTVVVVVFFGGEGFQRPIKYGSSLSDLGKQVIVLTREKVGNNHNPHLPLF